MGTSSSEHPSNDFARVCCPMICKNAPEQSCCFIFDNPSITFGMFLNYTSELPGEQTYVIVQKSLPVYTQPFFFVVKSLRHEPALPEILAHTPPPAGLPAPRGRPPTVPRPPSTRPPPGRSPAAPRPPPDRPPALYIQTSDQPHRGRYVRNTLCRNVMCINIMCR